MQNWFETVAFVCVACQPYPIQDNDLACFLNAFILQMDWKI